MSGLMTLDPQVRELLLEIAKDPRSTLFGKAPREVVTAGTLDMPSMSAGTAGWTPAERYLLAGYREQLAVALGDVFHRMSAEDARSIDFVEAGRGHGAVDRTGRLVTSNWFARIDSSLQVTVEAIAAGRGTSLGLDTVTNVICRLRNDHRSGNLHGMALIMEGKYAEAARLLRTVYEESIRPSVRYYAAVNLGLAMAEMGQVRESIGPSIAAAREIPQAASLASILINSTLFGHQGTAELAASYLDDVVPSHSGAVDDLIRMYSHREWTHETKNAFDGLRETSGPTTGRILDALLV